MKDFKTSLFSILIESDTTTIWDALWNPKSYEKWTSVFCDGNHYVGELRQGNTVQFLKADGEGMTSYIQKFVENEHIAFVHQAEIKNGVETTFDWKDAKEIYHLKKEGNRRTTLQVVVDVTTKMEEYFNVAFPKALLLIKQISEENYKP